MLKKSVFLLLICFLSLLFDRVVLKTDEPFRHMLTLKSPIAIFTEEDKALPCIIVSKGASVYYDGDSKYLDVFSRYIV